LEEEEEFAQAPSAQALVIATKIFNKFDADHNGTLDKDEARPLFIDYLRKAHATKLVVDDAVLTKWFDIADINRDGVISVEEAAQFVDTYMLKKNEKEYASPSN
jgi:Ca2+-binding EF-hand superfamily protein